MRSTWKDFALWANKKKTFFPNTPVFLAIKKNKKHKIAVTTLAPAVLFFLQYTPTHLEFVKKKKNLGNTLHCFYFISTLNIPWHFCVPNRYQMVHGPITRRSSSSAFLYWPGLSWLPWTRVMSFDAWWTCPMLTRFWTKVLKLVHSLFNCPFPRGPWYVLLHPTILLSPNSNWRPTFC